MIGTGCGNYGLLERCATVKECGGKGGTPGPCKKTGGRGVKGRAARNAPGAVAKAKSGNTRSGGPKSRDKKLIRSRTTSGRSTGASRQGVTSRTAALHRTEFGKREKVTKRAGGAALPIPKKATRSYRGIKGINDSRRWLGNGWLLEDITTSRPQRVDRDEGVIYGVKVVGLESENGRRYTAEALSRAKPLYEGLAVNIDHPKNASDSRSAHDRLGRLENVRMAEDGLYADMRILKTHPIAERLLEAAEAMPDLFGLSHNALGRGPERDGVLIVEEITDVRSVDLVAEPATTKSLFESRNRTMTTTLRAFLESVHRAAPAQVQSRIANLLEDDDVPLDMEMDAPADEPAPGGSDWRSALAGVLADLMATEDPEAHEIGSKLHNMLKIKDSPPEATTEEDDSESEGDDEEEVKEGEGDDDDEPKDAKESRRPKKPAPTVTVLTEARAKDICDLAGLGDDANLVKMVAGQSEARGFELVKWAKTRLTESRTSSTWNDPPRSQGGLRSGTPKKQSSAGGGYQSFLESIRN